MKKTYQIIMLIAALILASIAVWLYRWHNINYPSTDNAYVMANVVRMNTEVSGKIDKLYAENHQSVKKGQVMLVLDQKPFLIAKAQAENELATAIQQRKILQLDIDVAKMKIIQAQTDLEDINKKFRRFEILVKDSHIARADFDAVEAKRAIAIKQVSIAEKNLETTIGQYNDSEFTVNVAQEKLKQANLDLEHSVLKAPANGIIINLTERVGNYLTAGQAVFSLIEADYWWVDANFKETQVAKIQVGNPAKIKLDMYPNHEYHGSVIAISSGTGAAFSALPAENATGNWIKVTQRFTVKIEMPNKDPKYPLRMGASGNVSIDTNSILTQHGK